MVHSFCEIGPDVRKAGGNMSRREEYEQKAEALLAPIVAEAGFELVDVEYVKEAGNWYLRGYIDKPEGITVNDCEAVSRRFSDELHILQNTEEKVPSSSIVTLLSSYAWRVPQNSFCFSIGR